MALKNIHKKDGGLTRHRGQFNPEHPSPFELSRSKMESSQEEVGAKFVTNYRGKIPLNWKRDGNLIRRGRENKPKPGSSKGKVGKTRVIGFRKVIKDFEHLIKTLQDLQRRYGKGANVKTLQRAVKSVRTQATTNK